MQIFLLQFTQYVESSDLRDVSEICDAVDTIKDSINILFLSSLQNRLNNQI